MKKFVDFIASSSLFTLIWALELAIILFFGWCFGEIFLTSSPWPEKIIEGSKWLGIIGGLILVLISLPSDNSICSHFAFFLLGTFFLIQGMQFGLVLYFAHGESFPTFFAIMWGAVTTLFFYLAYSNPIGNPD